MNLVINWNVSAELIEGWSTPNLYGLLFVSGLILGYFVVQRMFKKEGIPEEQLDKLVLYMVLATIIGARLGHVLFYGPYFDHVHEKGYLVEGYFSHPLSILKVWEGGLASHGGAIAILISLMLYTKYVSKKSLMWILDRIVAPIAIGACFIRLGNLVNHEIVGDLTNVPWAFSFSHYYNETLGGYDPRPRHPAQLYESISYFILFVILMIQFWKREAWRKPGVLFGTFLIGLFGARFFIEFVKLGQAARDSDMIINTGQMLSIPFVLAGVYILYRGLKSTPTVDKIEVKEETE